MPKIPERKTKKVSLSEIPGSEVVVYTSLTVGDLIGMDDDISDISRSIQLMPKIIRSWNLTGENDEALPVSPETVGKLTPNCIAELTAHLSNESADQINEKKDLNDTPR